MARVESQFSDDIDQYIFCEDILNKSFLIN